MRKNGADEKRSGAVEKKILENPRSQCLGDLIFTEQGFARFIGKQPHWGFHINVIQVSRENYREGTVLIDGDTQWFVTGKYTNRAVNGGWSPYLFSPHTLPVHINRLLEECRNACQ